MTGQGHDTKNNDFDAPSAFPSLSAKMSKRLVKYGEDRIQASGLKKMYEELCKSPDSQEKHPEIHIVHRDEIKVGKLLGAGAFGNVYAVQVKKKPRVVRKINDTKNEEEGSHENNKDHHHGNHHYEGPPKDLVLKVLQSKWLENPNVFATSACDLVQEGLLLACLQGHPNIVGLYGWSNEDGIQAYLKGTHDAFYVLLERFDGTLADKLYHEWKDLYRQSTNRSIMLQNRQNKAWSHRHVVALEMASALEHMHSHAIIHRDLKPENIGLKDGHVKVFDLDVGRIVPTSKITGTKDGIHDSVHDDNFNDDPNFALFQMTACIGCERYQSPECGLGQRYNLKSDVYAFGLLLWEIWTLQKPYNTVPLHLHLQVVFQQGKRPKVPKLKKNNRGDDEGWTPEIIQLMEACWSPNVASRPTMKEARQQLQEALMPSPKGETEKATSTTEATNREDTASKTGSGSSSSSQSTSSSSKKPCSFFGALFGRRERHTACAH